MKRKSYIPYNGKRLARYIIANRVRRSDEDEGGEEKIKF